MSPGVNDPRNTGALPKSNRRNDRNRERSAANQIANRSAYHGRHQQSNNLFPLDWKPIGDIGPPRVAKNSNTRSVSSAPSTSYQDISDFASYSCGRQYNYSSEELGYWQKMVPPTDSRTQSPPRVQSTKPSNVDKMPDRSQVESRLNQIRDYIKVSSTMMDQLCQSNDPCAQAQHEKLGRMVEDLYDSERKLSKLLELYQNRPSLDQNGDSGGDDLEGMDDISHEMLLRKKMEESQRKMAQLQEHQASLVGMQLRLREQLTHARQAQQALLESENSNTPSPPVALPSKLEQLENETAALKGKLAQLQSKKKHMDHFVAELQAMELTSDRASSSSDSSRNIRDKTAELEAMRAQVAHLKALMEEATKAREYGDNTSEPEPEVDIADEGGEDAEAHDDENETNMLFERQSDSDEASHGKVTNTDDRPLVEKILAGTQEVRDAAQTALLQSVGTVLQRLQQPAPSPNPSNTPSTYPSFTPPPSLAASINSENKQTNTAIIESQAIQEKRRQLEDFARKESQASQASSVNCDAPVPEASSHKSSSSQISHSSTPANMWPSPAGLHERKGEAITSSESLLDAGSIHPPAIENSFHANWLPYPMPPMTQLQHGSAEYYRQLLLGSQSQQLQMMGVTLQQCCQLLASQQRELQSMRSAITQLQVQVRQNQSAQRVSNAENPEEYSNLSRSTHHLGETLDGSLPPSSSLPNLVSLPNSSPAVSHTTTGGAINSQPHNQQQQLNNQVPPGNRANNYWDNFRSYSRQNLLSGNVKTVTDTSSGAVANTVSSGNSTANGVTGTLIKDKRNRDQGSEHLPPFVAAEAQYSLNLQSQSNVQLQERDNIVSRSNIFANEISQQQPESHRETTHAPHRLPTGGNDDNPLQNLSPEMEEELYSLVSLEVVLEQMKLMDETKRRRSRLLKLLRGALQDTQSSSNHLNETTDQTVSESCQSSDEDSDAGLASGINLETQPSVAELSTVPQAGTSSSPTIQAPLMDNSEVPETPSSDHLNTLPLSSNLKPGYNEDLAEADQSRPESSGNQQISNGDCGPEEDQEEGAACLTSVQSTVEVDADFESSARAEDERPEVPKSEKVNARQYHH